MNNETPLPEVAALLPTQAAQMLMGHDSDFQTLVVSLLREQIIYWESQHVMLDPVQFDVVVTGFVATVMFIARPS